MYFVWQGIIGVHGKGLLEVEGPELELPLAHQASTLHAAPTGGAGNGGRVPQVKFNAVSYNLLWGSVGVRGRVVSGGSRSGASHAEITRDMCTHVSTSPATERHTEGI